MRIKFSYTKECQETLRVAVQEIRDRIVDDKETRIQRVHTDVVEWKDTETDERRRAEIRTVVTNPAGTDNLKATLDVDVAADAVDEALRGSKHSITRTDFGGVQERANAILEECLEDEVYAVPTMQLRTGGAILDDSISYYGEAEVSLS